MKKIALLLLPLLTVCLHSFSKEFPLLFTIPKEGNIQLLKAGKHSYCITNDGIYELEKKQLIQKISLQQRCNDAAVYNNNIVLATSNGIQLFNTKTNILTALFPETIKGDINGIQTDNKHLWFTKAFEGCFMIDDSNKVIQRVKVPVTYALAYTDNGNMWVGTNVGLYKIPIHGGEIVRYAEEGIASNDLPDNLVERLFTDAQSNVWVMMPGHITFIAADSEDEFPDYEHVGKKDNELYDIAAASDKMYLFATAQGILLMQNSQHGEALYTGEIHQTINEKAYLLTDEITEKPEHLKNEPVIKIVNSGRETHFITNKGLWSVSTSKFIHTLEEHY